MNDKINSIESSRSASKFVVSDFEVEGYSLRYAAGELKKIGNKNAKVVEYYLSDLEVSEVSDLIKYVSKNSSNSDPCIMANYASIYSGELPRGIREVVAWFKQTEPAMALVIKNNPVNENCLSDTPNTRVELEDNYRLNTSQQLHAIYGGLLGQQMSFSSQFNGSLFNNIIPISSFESISNASSGFRHDFDFHVEDAFHPYMPDYLGLICHRNFEEAKTMLTTIGPDDINDKEFEILNRPRYRITNNALHTDIEEVNKSLHQILFGSRVKPYIRINICDIDFENLTEEECLAVNNLVEKLKNNYLEVVLRSGDCIYIDNFRALHGRASYSPNFGKKARWLTRITLANDLRKSANMRGKEKNRRVITA